MTGLGTTTWGTTTCDVLDEAAGLVGHGAGLGGLGSAGHAGVGLVAGGLAARARSWAVVHGHDGLSSGSLDTALWAVREGDSWSGGK